MSAQPVHGGGITLRRVLGDDLERFDWIAKSLHYPGEKWPEYGPHCRSHCYPWWKLEQRLRPIVRCTLAHRIAFHPQIRKAFIRHVTKRLLKDQPDLLDSRLLVCPQADVTVVMLEQFKKIKPVRYVTWVMDDHRLKWRDGDWVYPRGFEPLMRRHLRDAERVHVISPALQEFYQSRFDVESTVLCAPATPDDFHLPEMKAGERLKLVYFGSVGPWQNDAIELLIPALARREAALDVYTHNPDAIPRGLKEAGAILRTGVPADEVPKLCRQYDAVVLPISFGNERRNMSYFNIATKFAECLAVGIPTLIVGPPYAIMVRIASKHDAAVIVDRPDPEAMTAALNALKDRQRTRAVAQAALNLVREDYSVEVMNDRFKMSRSFLFNGDGFKS